VGQASSWSEHTWPLTAADGLGWRDAQSDPEPSTAGGHGSGGCGGLEQSWDTLSYFSRHQRGNIHSPVKPSRGDIDSISEDQSPSKVFSTTTTSAAPASPNNWWVGGWMRYVNSPGVR
jgi:hypothetical protein